jgi:Ca2+-binding RTX toxin-like protein
MEPRGRTKRERNMAMITETSGNNNLPGTADSDEIYGLARDDHFSGLDGNDLLEGGAGGDQFDGGNGFDYLGPTLSIIEGRIGSH